MKVKKLVRVIPFDQKGVISFFYGSGERIEVDSIYDFFLKNCRYMDSNIYAIYAKGDKLEVEIERETEGWL